MILPIFSYKLCLAEVKNFIHLPGIQQTGCWDPAARLGVAIAELLAILDSSHTQVSTPQHTRGSGDWSLLCASTIIPVSEITRHMRTSRTEHSGWELPVSLGQ